MYIVHIRFCRCAFKIEREDQYCYFDGHNLGRYFDNITIAPYEREIP